MTTETTVYRITVMTAKNGMEFYMQSPSRYGARHILGNELAREPEWIWGAVFKQDSMGAFVKDIEVSRTQSFLAGKQKII